MLRMLTRAAIAALAVVFALTSVHADKADDPNARILRLDPLPARPSFFWSDQFGMRLQLVGDTRAAAAVQCEGSEASFTARYFNREGRLVAALAANRAADIAVFRRELALAA